MWRILVSSLVLVSVASGQLARGYEPRIPGGYLPPPGPGNPPAVVIPCPGPKTRVLTNTVVITRVVTSTVVSTVGRVVTTTNVITSTVPKTVLSTVISTKLSVRVKIRSVTVTAKKTVTNTVSQPGTTRVVQQTQVKTVVSVYTQRQTVTLTSTVVQPTTQVQRITSTVTQVVRVTVPQVVKVAKTQQVPGATIRRTIQKQVTVTLTSTVQLPPRTLVSTQLQYVTSIRVKTVAGPTVVRTQQVVRTVVVTATSVVRVPQVSTVQVQVTVQKTQYVTSTQVVTQTQTIAVTSTQVVPATVYKTLIKIVTVPVVRKQIRTVVATLPGQNIVRSVAVTNTQTVTQTGKDQIVTSTVTVQKIRTQVIYSTQIQPTLVTREIVSTKPCGGYQYNAPDNPLII